MLSSDFTNTVLFEPIRRGADRLNIVSGYATPTMASWHIKEIQTLSLPPIEIYLIVGMCPYDGLSIDVHNGFKELVESSNSSARLSKLTCQYVYQGPPVHSKLYLWSKDGIPVEAYAGSPNYTQSAFSHFRRELMASCDASLAHEYFNQIEGDTIFCTHSEVEEHIILYPSHPVLDAESSPIVNLRGSGIENITLSFLARTGEVGNRSGLNWGQRAGREPNQAYIPLPAEISRSGFFPLGKRHFSVITDDGKQLILRVEQENNKAITTPLNNSQIGEYFRNRLGLPNGSYISKADLERYGRTDVTFYKFDEEHFFMDFSVHNN